MNDKTDRYRVVENILRGIPGFSVKTGVRPPEVTYASIDRNRSACRTNICGNYNNSWTCPPNCGSPEYCIEAIGSCRDADIVMMEFPGDCLDDMERMDASMTGFREVCRKIKTRCTEEGYDVLVFADGPCGYCEECAIRKGKNCNHPEMQIPSVSGYGIDMASYMDEVGIPFSFSKERVILYGIVLFR